MIIRYMRSISLLVRQNTITPTRYFLIISSTSPTPAFVTTGTPDANVRQPGEPNLPMPDENITDAVWRVKTFAHLLILRYQFDLVLPIAKSKALRIATAESREIISKCGIFF